MMYKLYIYEMHFDFRSNISVERVLDVLCTLDFVYVCMNHFKIMFEGCGYGSYYLKPERQTVAINNILMLSRVAILFN